MREILFRGKNVDTGKWVYGGYAPYPHTRFPCTPTIYEVDRGLWKPVEIIAETLGQYIGLNDRHGQRIFEGDIVNFKTTLYRFERCVVEYFVGDCCFVAKLNNRSYPMAVEFEYEIIGNIHDNPELIGGVKDV